MPEKYYAAIDLKSFFASVECNERGLNPLTTNLVVADLSRTEKTICLAVSPSLKAYGLPGRARLFEVIAKVKEINRERLKAAPLGVFLGKSSDHEELQKNPNLELDFIIATPRMQYYLDYSALIYQTYLRHVAPEDIFAYSIDEIFCDLTSYLQSSGLTPADYVTKMINDVYETTHITATAGIGTNLYLAKVAMDILAKHATPNASGVRIAELNVQTYREQLWTHQPITDFWRVGRGTAKRLARYNLLTMGDVARCSLDHEDLLYRLFGVNAELLIDHSWGYEPVSIADIKQHHARAKSLSSGQVLASPYDFAKARVILQEMADSLSLDLARKHYVAGQIALHVDFDRATLDKTAVDATVSDHYGREVPSPVQASKRLALPTASTKLITAAFLELFDQRINPNFLIRKITIGAGDVVDVDFASAPQTKTLEQTNLFTDYHQLATEQAQLKTNLQKETALQQAVLNIRERYGKNSILRGINFENGATGRTRHRQIGGHRA